MKTRIASFSSGFRGHSFSSHTSHKSGNGDKLLIVFIVLLAAIGILMVYDSSVAIALRDFGDPYHFVREQIKWLVLGFLAFATFSKIPYTYWKRIAVPMLLGTMVLLIAVFIPGFGVRALGAHRWLNFGFFILQPAELAKLSVVLYLSAWFCSKESNRLIAFFLLMGMVTGLIVLEPDLGTSIIIMSTAILMYFLSGAAIWQFAAIIPVVLVGVIILAVSQPYRMNRVLTFFNPESDPQGTSYQIRQVLLSLGSGGWTGVGLGKSRQKYEYLPEANTDSIFAILGEETGFIGGLFVIALLQLMLWRGFYIARATTDPYGRMLVLGVVSWVGMQSLINLGSMVALVPLTGVPLPLISYGGSNLVITLGALGIVHNVSKHI